MRGRKILKILMVSPNLLEELKKYDRNAVSRLAYEVLIKNRLKKMRGFHNRFRAKPFSGSKAVLIYKPPKQPSGVMIFYAERMIEHSNERDYKNLPKLKKEEPDENELNSYTLEAVAIEENESLPLWSPDFLRFFYRKRQSRNLNTGQVEASYAAESPNHQKEIQEETSVNQVQVEEFPTPTSESEDFVFAGETFKATKEEKSIYEFVLEKFREKASNSLLHIYGAPGTGKTAVLYNLSLKMCMEGFSTNPEPQKIKFICHNHELRNFLMKNFEKDLSLKAGKSASLNSRVEFHTAYWITTKLLAKYGIINDFDRSEPPQVLVKSDIIERELTEKVREELENFFNSKNRISGNRRQDGKKQKERKQSTISRLLGAVERLFRRIPDENPGLDSGEVSSVLSSQFVNSLINHFISYLLSKTSPRELVEHIQKGKLDLLTLKIFRRGTHNPITNMLFYSAQDEKEIQIIRSKIHQAKARSKEKLIAGIAEKLNEFVRENLIKNIPLKTGNQNYSIYHGEELLKEKGLPSLGVLTWIITSHMRSPEKPESWIDLAYQNRSADLSELETNTILFDELQDIPPYIYHFIVANLLARHLKEDDDIVFIIQAGDFKQNLYEPVEFEKEDYTGPLKKHMGLTITYQSLDSRKDIKIREFVKSLPKVHRFGKEALTESNFRSMMRESYSERYIRKLNFSGKIRTKVETYRCGGDIDRAKKQLKEAIKRQLKQYESLMVILPKGDLVKLKKTGLRGNKMQSLENLLKNLPHDLGFGNDEMREKIKFVNAGQVKGLESKSVIIFLPDIIETSTHQMQNLLFVMYTRAKENLTEILFF